MELAIGWLDEIGMLHAPHDGVGRRVDHQNRIRLGAHDVSVELSWRGECRLVRLCPEPGWARGPTTGDSQEHDDGCCKQPYRVVRSVSHESPFPAYTVD